MLFTRVHRGAANVIHHEFEPKAALEAIEEHDVTVLFAAPTVWNALARTAAEIDVDVSSLERGLYGAAPMPEEVLNMAMEHLCEDYIQAYGMTEIGPCGVFQRHLVRNTTSPTPLARRWRTLAQSHTPRRKRSDFSTSHTELGIDSTAALTVSPPFRHATLIPRKRGSKPAHYVLDQLN